MVAGEDEPHARFVSYTSSLFSYTSSLFAADEANNVSKHAKVSVLQGEQTLRPP